MYKITLKGWTMKTTLDISEELIKEAVRLSGSRTKTEAVTMALKDMVRKQKIEKIISQAGTLDFSRDWEEARHGR